KNDFRMALTAYAAAARLEGAGSDARTSVGRMQLQLGRPREAARTFDDVSSESFQRGRVDEGLAALRRAADAEPTVERWRRLVDWCVHLGRTADAQQHLEEATTRLFAEDAFAQLVPIARMLLELRPNHVPT